MKQNQILTKKLLNKAARSVYGVLGIILGLIIAYAGLQIGSELGDRIAELRGVSYESYTVVITILLFMMLLLLAGYLIYKKLIRNNILGKSFLWTLVIADSLYILFLLFYLSL